MPTRDSNQLLHRLDPEIVDRILALSGPDADCPQVFVEVRHLGGALTAPSAAASAYAHRDAAYAVSTVGLAVPPFQGAVAEHAAELAEALAPWATGGCLPNWQAGGDPQVLGRKYPAAVLARLSSLVEAYDPGSVLAAGREVVAAAGARP